MAGQRIIPFTMEEIFDFMGVDYLRHARGRNAFNIPCPNCDRGNSNKKRLNVNLSKKVWRCPKCGSYGDGVNYYSLVTTGNYQLTSSQYGEMIGRIQAEMSGDKTFASRRAQSAAIRETAPKINSAELASDDVLHKTFSKLLEFPAFVLTEEHRQNLLGRGLNSMAIVRNGYRSIPPVKSIDVYIDPAIRSAYERYGWTSIKSKMYRINRLSDTSVMLGLSIAKWLEENGCTLHGVPGFFKFKKHWCFLVPEDSGIFIPARNMKRQIVALQVRTDHGSIRYMTISASGLELAVTERISRVHWPLANELVAPVFPGSHFERPEIMITEGPLKADVAIHLMRSDPFYVPTAFVAIQGIYNTNALMEDCDKLVELGYNKVYDALDMDRLTNLNVWKGDCRLNQLLREKNISLKQRFWDRKYAATVLNQVKDLCKRTKGADLPKQLDANPFVALSQCMNVLARANYAGDSIDWDKKTKGIDDFLFSLKSKGKA